jgi:hypothetical protein
MRKLALIIAAIGALAVTAPAFAAETSTGTVQTQQAHPGQKQADEFSSSHRRHWHHRHHHWRRHHWQRHHYGHRCRTVWRPHYGYVRVCRW